MPNTLSPQFHTYGKAALQPLTPTRTPSGFNDPKDPFKDPIATNVSCVIITPEFAAKLLSYNTQNRNLSGPRAKALAKVITKGHWKFNYATIVLANISIDCGDGDILQSNTELSETNNCSPTLLDGQHRLEACKLPVPEMAGLVIKAWNFERRGKKIRTLVFKSAEDFPTIV